MTVEQLIARLQQMPQGANVWLEINVPDVGEGMTYPACAPVIKVYVDDEGDVCLKDAD